MNLNNKLYDESNITSDIFVLEKKFTKSYEPLIHLFLKQHIHKILRMVEYPMELFMDEVFIIYKDSVVMFLNVCQTLNIQKSQIFKRAKCLKYKTNNKYIRGYNKN